ncbi:MAG: ferredoxin [Gammaproteobacteria bacterium]
MKVIVDNNKCHGHARCVAKAGDVYVLNDSGYNEMGTFEVPKALEEKARWGARACPEKAITIVEDGA